MYILISYEPCTKSHVNEMPYDTLICLPISYVYMQMICLIPYQWISWLALLGAGGSSCVFVMRNLAPTVIQHARNQALVCLGIIAGMQLAFVITLKLCFYYSLEEY